METLVMQKLGALLAGTNDMLRPMPSNQTSNKNGAKEEENPGEPEEIEKGEGAGGDEGDEDTEAEEGEGGGDAEDAEDAEDGEAEDGEDGEDAEGTGGGNAEEADDTDGEDGDGEDGDGEGADGEAEDGEGADGEGADGEDGEDGEDGGEDGEDAEGGGQGGEGDADDEYDDEYDDEVEDDGGEEMGEGGSAAGGDGTSADAENEGLDIEGLLEALMEDDTGLKDTLTALTEGFDVEEDDVLEDEEVWRPMTTADDVIEIPKEEWDFKERRETYARKTKKAKRALKPVIAAIKALFKNKFLQSRQPTIKHGVRRGSDLSERRLVESFIEIKSKKPPSRPWQKITKAEAESLAIAVVGDQSGSMNGNLCKNAALGMFAIASAFEALGSPILCLGVKSRGGYQAYNHRSEAAGMGADLEKLDGGFHRHCGITYNLFKDWDEKLRDCEDAFWTYDASGGTPLSDGIQMALQELSDRPERHRIVLVITDGMPNKPEVVRRQIRLAKEQGIHVVGVGIGYCASYVTHLFPANVQCHQVDALPKALVNTVESLVFPKTTKRAKFSAGVKKTRRF